MYCINVSLKVAAQKFIFQTKKYLRKNLSITATDGIMILFFV